MKKLLSAILIAIAGAALVFGAAATCRARDCYFYGGYAEFQSKNRTIVYLLTITETDSEDPVVIYQRPQPKIDIPRLTVPASKLTAEQRSELLEKRRKAYDQITEPPAAVFVDGYWDGSGIAVDACLINETASGTLKSLSITEEAAPYPIALVTYKHIQEKPQRKVTWKIFPVYSPEQLIPEKPEDIPDAESSMIGALSIARPFGKGGIKLKYIDNKRLFTNEKDLGYEETWRLPFQPPNDGAQVGEPPKNTGEETRIFAAGHTLKIINHGVYVLALSPEDKNEEK